MPDIKDTVGEGAKNAVHDVALVQAMLRVVKDAKGVPYLGGNYDGIYGGQTKAAIIAFQTDHKLAAAPGKEPAPGQDQHAVAGPNGATIKKLVSMLPATHAKLQIIENTKTVYLEGEAADATASQGKIAAHPELEVTFRANVAKLVELMFKTHKIVLSVAPLGTRRTFAEQAALDPSVTKAGPGESNHNFGRAVDIGPNGLKWLQGDGAIVKDDWWMNKLFKVSVAKTESFWEARDNVADNAKLNLFRIGAWDHPHLQSFSEAKLNTARSLAALLTAVGKTKWVAAPASPNHYKSDLGLGGKTYDVGTAKQIWAGNATVTKAMLAEAQSAKFKKVVKEDDIKDADLTNLRKELKADFEAADTNWTKWTPVA